MLSPEVKVATGVTVEPPGGHAARGGEGQDRLERRACGDCSEVVGDEAVGRPRSEP